MQKSVTHHNDDVYEPINGRFGSGGDSRESHRKKRGKDEWEKGKSTAEG